MRKRTLKEKFYTGCGYSIFGALAFVFFLGLSVAYGIKTASIIVGARENEFCCGCDNRQTNADRIRNMSDEELAEFMSENTSYYYCGVRCKDRPKSPAESSCNFRWLEWLQSEAE